uniref:Glycosyl transferase 64 domain-containing protein n=1 Tax=Ditylum brightwellii TaxID=49249 RepID=A0A7S1Z3N2_9STRA
MRMDENNQGSYRHKLQEQQHLRHLHHPTHHYNYQHQYQDDLRDDKDDDEKKRRRTSWRNLTVQTALSSFLLMVRRRWSVLKKRSRLILVAIFIFMSFYSMISTMDYFYSSYGVDSVRKGRRSIQLAVPTTPAFAVVINTYKRPYLLQKAVRHYGEKCGRKNRVVQIFIVWGDLDVAPPDPYSFYTKVDESSAAARNRATVSILRAEKDSLNSRFLPIDGLVGEALFMVDDDITVECTSLSRGFEAWRSQPYALVGYYPRLASPPLKESNRLTETGDKKIVYHGWPRVFWTGKFNFVLTKASFLHAMYLDLYSGPTHPQEIRDYVDEHHNCEDVAMALLVANQTKVTGRPGSDHSPVYVEGNVADGGALNGISTSGHFALATTPSSHMSERSSCLVDLNRMYKERGWESPLHQVQLRDQSWVRHFPGFWWQIRPCNLWEWLSLGNIFT